MMVKSVYIHVPFCKTICSYCDFCKVFYQKNWVKEYLKELQKEVETIYQNEVLDTIYIGGGTPSCLNLEELEILFSITDILRKSNNVEFTIECNIESITEEKLKLFKKAGITRISYGVQTFHKSYLTYLNRHHTKEEVKKIIDLTKQYIPNINVDLMYALKDETIKEVEEDLNYFLKLEIPHISTYSLIIEPHTVLGIKETYIEDEIDFSMYQVICNTLKMHEYKHYEVSNFCKIGYESRHNLTYWNNEQYYGFGLGASGYLGRTRYTNTRSINHYLNGNWMYEKEILTDHEIMENECILGLRKLEGISLDAFYQKYHKQLEEIFEYSSLLKKGLLEVQNGYLKIPEDKIYLSNEVLIHFIGEA